LFDVALGPIAGFPSVSREVLRSGKRKLGPKLIAGITAKRWVALLLVRNLWSVGGDANRPDVNALLLQYLLFYNFPKGWYLAMEPIITANWTQSGTNRWTVPFGIGVGKFFRIGRMPITTRAQAFYNAVRPDFVAAIFAVEAVWCRALREPESDPRGLFLFAGIRRRLPLPAARS